MKLSERGSFARLYLFFSDSGRLPNDFCTFFWGLVWRGFLFFGLVGVILFTLIYWLTVGLMAAWRHRTGVLEFVGMLAAISLITYVLARLKRVKIQTLNDAEAILSGKIDAVKNRYCPRIEWED